MPHPWSWSYLTHRPVDNEVYGPFSTAYLIFLLLAFCVTVFLYNNGGQYLTTDPVRRRYLRKYAGFLLIPIVLGIFFFLVRMVQIDPFTFGRRIWLYLTAVAILGLVVWIVVDIRRHYARDLAMQHRSHTQRTYLRSRRRAS